MDRNNLFPIFLKLEELSLLLVGGGNVGLEKLEAIRKNSPHAKVTLVAGKIRDEIREMAKVMPTLKLVQRNYRFWDLYGKDLVILATDNPTLHQRIRRQAKRRHTLVNVADTPDQCDYYLGSVVTKGNLKIGISTNGKSPTIAKRMREYLEESLPEETNELLDNMRSIRDRLKGDFSSKVKALNDITSSWLANEGSQNLPKEKE